MTKLLYSEVKLGYNLRYPSSVSTRLVDLNGKVMWRKDVRFQSEGEHSVSISASQLPSGVYFVSIGDGREMLNRIVVLLK